MRKQKKIKLKRDFLPNPNFDNIDFAVTLKQITVPNYLLEIFIKCFYDCFLFLKKMCYCIFCIRVIDSNHLFE